MAKNVKSTSSVHYSIPISESIGKVSANLLLPAKPIAILTLAHGAGAGMDHKFMVELAERLAELDVATVRFNFPFTENGKKRPDPAAVAQKTISEVLIFVHEKFPEYPLYASGKSFGGRMSSQQLAKETPEFVKGIVFFGFPLHAPGSVSRDRAEHLYSLSLPMLFLQGTKDALADAKEMKKVTAKIKNATLIFYEGADHSFKVKGSHRIDQLATDTRNWLDS